MVRGCDLLLATEKKMNMFNERRRGNEKRACNFVDRSRNSENQQCLREFENRLQQYPSFELRLSLS